MSNKKNISAKNIKLVKNKPLTKEEYDKEIDRIVEIIVPQLKLTERYSQKDIKDMNVYRKHAVVSTICQNLIPRNGENNLLGKDKIPYIKLSDIQQRLIPVLAFNFHLDLIISKYPDVVRDKEKLHTKTTYKNGTVVEADKVIYERQQMGKITLVNIDKPAEMIVFDGIDFSGMNKDISMAGGNGDTYGTRYGLGMVFQIPNDDVELDVESDKHTELINEMNESITSNKKEQAIQNEVERVISAMSKNPNVKDEVKKILNKQDKFSKADIVKAITDNQNVFETIA